MSDLIVKTNRLNTATQNLSLTEVRIMQLAIVDARETGQGLSADKPLVISALRYAEAFKVTRQTAWEAILNAEKTLFERRFTFLNERERQVKTRWIQRVEYIENEASIAIILTHDVVHEITQIDGYEQFFTQYLLEQTADMKSAYSVRLYELMVQWKTVKKTPLFELQLFREQLGVERSEYNRIYDFKKYVLDLAVNEINEKSDLEVAYTQQKKGRKIVGFSFTIKQKKPSKKEEIRDPNTIDWVNGVTDNEIKGMTSAQAKKYAELLHREPAIVGNWKDCADYTQAKAKLTKQLQQPEYVRKYMPYLLNCDDPFDPKTVGFKGEI